MSIQDTESELYLTAIKTQSHSGKSRTYTVDKLTGNVERNYLDELLSVIEYLMHKSNRLEHETTLLKELVIAIEKFEDVELEWLVE